MNRLASAGISDRYNSTAKKGSITRKFLIIDPYNLSLISYNRCWPRYFSKIAGVQHNAFPSQLLRITYGSRRTATPLAILNSQQNSGGFYQPPVAFQHTALAVLLTDVNDRIGALQNCVIPFLRGGRPFVGLVPAGQDTVQL